MKNLIQIAAVFIALSLSSTAFAKSCDIEIDSTDSMTFDKKELAISSECTEVNLTLNHVGEFPKNVMGHNWVLTQTADMQEVVNAGGAAGLDNEYLPADQSKVIAATKIIGGGESTTITFSTSGLEKGGDYTFFCSFPGHWAIMQGKFIVN
ncbi:azurin [Aliidiomarina taiwanensis]|uniref:Azurin n=1 Tax=Aliidiomarina taiwanensis TaxID=946228 RepID=A0A432X177_9GAMM|nr:azurin [Aliidiomarina taiwanensis]RUO39894.1 azurin [Aliidiomarina taiwanensis]